jgi:hypothetical protein
MTPTALTPPNTAAVNATPAATAAAGGISLIGLLTLAASLGAAFTGHGSGADTAGVISGAAGLLAGPWAWLRHHDQVLARYVTVTETEIRRAEAARPDASELWAAAAPVLADARRLGTDLIPSWTGQILELHAKAAAAIDGIETKVRQAVETEIDLLPAADSNTLDALADKVRDLILADTLHPKTPTAAPAVASPPLTPPPASPSPTVPAGPQTAPQAS